MNKFIKKMLIHIPIIMVISILLYFGISLNLMILVLIAFLLSYVGLGILLVQYCKNEGAKK